MPHRGLEPASVLRLAFQSDAPIEHPPPYGYMAVMLYCTIPPLYDCMAVMLYWTIPPLYDCMAVMLYWTIPHLYDCMAVMLYWTIPHLYDYMAVLLYWTKPHLYDYMAVMLYWIMTALGYTNINAFNCTGAHTMHCVVTTGRTSSYRIQSIFHSSPGIVFMHLSTRTVHSCHSAPSRS